jgi:uncharacterized protein YbjQ (UPF0145 family)
VNLLVADSDADLDVEAAFDWYESQKAGLGGEFSALEKESTMSLIVTTGNEVAGREIRQYLGVVRGLVVRAPNLGQTLLGSLRAIGGGNITEFTSVCEAARQEAYDLLVRHAQQLGADAVIGMRYDATEFYQNATEVLAYGTAVRLS